MNAAEYSEESKDGFWEDCRKTSKHFHMYATCGVTNALVRLKNDMNIKLY